MSRMLSPLSYGPGTRERALSSGRLASISPAPPRQFPFLFLRRRGELVGDEAAPAPHEEPRQLRRPPRIVQRPGAALRLPALERQAERPGPPSPRQRRRRAEGPAQP